MGTAEPLSQEELCAAKSLVQKCNEIVCAVRSYLDLEDVDDLIEIDIDEAFDDLQDACEAAEEEEHNG